MAKFVLQPCELRDFRICVLKDVPPVEVDWQGLLEMFKPEQNSKTLTNLRLLRQGLYVGMCKGRISGTAVPFVLELPHGQLDKSIEYLTKDYPDIEKRIKTIFLVRFAQWEAVVLETDSKGQLETKAQPSA